MTRISSNEKKYKKMVGARAMSPAALGGPLLVGARSPPSSFWRQPVWVAKADQNDNDVYRGSLETKRLMVSFSRPDVRAHKLL